MKKYLFVLMFFVSQIAVSSLPPYYFEHYSTEDGLPQQSVFNMLQDKKGFMWFGTWNGFCKYDGYEFIDYNAKCSAYNFKSSRIGRMFEDRYGYIWLQSYDGEAHRFDTDTETFKSIRSEQFPNFSFFLSKLDVKRSGKAWLMSNQTGCICVIDSTFSTVAYGLGNDPLKNKKVTSVFEDSEQNSWLLTNNGIGFIPRNSTKINLFFAEKETEKDVLKQSFSSAFEIGNEIWFGTNTGRIWIYTKSNKQFRLFETGASSRIIKFIKSADNYLSIITRQNGIFIYNLKTKNIENFAPKNGIDFPGKELVSGYADKRGNIWLGMDCLGTLKFDCTTHQYKYFPYQSDIINERVYSTHFFITEDKNDNLFVHPKGGGFAWYDPATDNLVPFFDIKSERDWWLSNMLHMAYFDAQGNLWLCTRLHGLEKVVFDKNAFKTIVLNPNSFNISNEVRAVFEDSDCNLWISTKDSKLRLYDKNRKLLGYLQRDGSIKPTSATLPSIVYCMAQDDKQNIWLGTKGEGIFKLSKHGTLSFNISNYKNNASDIYSLSNNSIYSIFQDSQKNIWIGSFDGGLNLLKEDTSGKIVFINHRNQLKNYPIDDAYRIRCINEDKFGNVCVGTTNGMVLFKSKFSTPENIAYKYYTYTGGNAKSLSSSDIQFIRNTQQGNMFIATSGGGINKVTARDKSGFPTAFASFTMQDGMPSDVTLSIEEDGKGKLWIATENNLVKFDPQKNTFETFGEIKRLMAMSNFSEASSLITHTGEILVGYSGGLLSFYSDEIKKNDFKPYIALEHLKLFNKDVLIGSENSPLKQSLNAADKLKLTHKQNFFSIKYAALDFIDPKNISYAYKLEGFDEDWNYVQNGRIATYTNLPKGKYVFRVKSTNSDGVWIGNERQLPIEILPSFWETIWAYLLYIVLFGILIFVILRILLTFYNLRHKIKMEEELSKLKLKFFTDISHEIRTPLTMVTAPIEYMQQDERTPGFIRKQLDLISNNTDRILRLVNQILDFSRIEHLKLKIEEIEIVPFVQSVCDNFIEIARNRNIHFSFVNLAEGEMLWINRDSVEKIVYNLLSNAFKYTPEGKNITVTVRKESGSISIEVKDQGIGIPKEIQKKLFNRFVSFNEDKSKPSTGIGLSLAKELANKHHAKLSVESEAGKGSTFTATFLCGINHFDSGVDVIPTHKKETFLQTEIEKQTIAEELTETPTITRPTILIVEDDDDLRQFIRTILSSEYEIIEAEDGEAGFALAQTAIPDFVVSDIMMPKMDGVQLLQKLKKTLNTSHIPVVLLTAKTTIESKLQGLEYGADDYVTKPFSVPYFRARIENLLKQRWHLQQLYCSDLFAANAVFEPKQPKITSQDEAFMQKTIQTIEENMDNSKFAVEDLASATGTSRTVFFKKIKSLTGLAPVEFIRDIKIKRAAQLLATGQFSVKEIGYMVGMTDSKYFNKCFKAKYSMTPSEYKNKK